MEDEGSIMEEYAATLYADLDSVALWPTRSHGGSHHGQPEEAAETWWKCHRVEHVCRESTERRSYFEETEARVPLQPLTDQRHTGEAKPTSEIQMVRLCRRSIQDQHTPHLALRADNRDDFVSLQPLTLRLRRRDGGPSQPLAQQDGSQATSETRH